MAQVFLPLSLLFFAYFTINVASQGLPAYIPLAIRSPYFNTWVKTSDPMHSWPSFWNGATLGWAGIVRVDDVAYEWMGNGNPALNTTTLVGLEVTPTSTIFSFLAGTSMLVNVTFMTPIEPDDPVKQSLPFSYIALDASSQDGQPHSVQAYLDISGEWTSGNRSNNITWQATNTDTSTAYEYQLQTMSQFQEVKDQAEDVNMYIAMRSGPSVKASVAVDVDNRGAFASKGTLAGPINPPHFINSPYPVFAVATDLGKITATSSSLVWAIGVVRNPVVGYNSGNGASQDRAPYFLSKFPDVSSALDSFILDYDNAKQRSNALNAKIIGDAGKVSPTYTNLVSLAARQAMGGTDLTVARGTDSSWNTSDVKMFMKDVGTSGRVNPVESLYAAFPFFLYINASYAGWLLEPLLEFQSSPSYTQPFAASDLGSSYPQASGSNQAHARGIEQSGNMLIMALSHALVSGDGSLINRYYALLSDWATYLINTVPNPGSQANADNESQPNMSNLLIKGIIGVQAMAKISSTLGRGNDSTRFANEAQSLLQTWQTSALSTDGTHLLATYGDQSSWTLPYNLYADKLLQTNLVNGNLYSSETTFLKGLLASTGGPVTSFGVPVDLSTNSQTDAGWTLFTAAVSTDPGVRDSLISPVFSHIVSNQSTFPFSKVYKLDSTGAAVSGQASPALGAIFAPLALSLPFQTITVPPPPKAPAASSQKASITGPVVGGVVGGVGLIALVAAAFFLWRRRQRNKSRLSMDMDMDQPSAAYPPVTVYHLPRGRSSSEPLSPHLRDSSSDFLARSTTTSTAVSNTVARSSKAREAAREREIANRIPPSTPSASAYSNSNTDSSGGGSSREPPTTIGGSTVSHTEVQGLRDEVENLRRAMQEIQAERVEAPPMYSQ
ncbi:hypothetical protein EIP91_011516 [Steccherinum ochraceum]|uniref:DUF1793-domain-containing protein n=1 Tax=Steccherinum ochraceum TaxID=92696 RepID=A0A4R0QZP0_9APHY|nr:hypothetical protein EIP91_011516 [Steccherinum ochraceum]